MLLFADLNDILSLFILDRLVCRLLALLVLNIVLEDSYALLLGLEEHLLACLCPLLLLLLLFAFQPGVRNKILTLGVDFYVHFQRIAL